MSDLDFDRKHAEDLQRLRGLRLLDDDFMNKVFEEQKPVPSSCARSSCSALICAYSAYTANTILRIYRDAPCGWIFWLWMKRTASIISRCSATTKALV